MLQRLGGSEAGCDVAGNVFLDALNQARTEHVRATDGEHVIVVHPLRHFPNTFAYTYALEFLFVCKELWH